MRYIVFAILGGSHDDHLDTLVANSRLEVCEALNVVVLRGGWPGICDRREVILGHKLMCYQVYVWWCDAQKCLTDLCKEEEEEDEEKGRRNATSYTLIQLRYYLLIIRKRVSGLSGWRDSRFVAGTAVYNKKILSTSNEEVLSISISLLGSGGCCNTC